jgi:hypothetical protein
MIRREHTSKRPVTESPCTGYKHGDTYIRSKRCVGIYFVNNANVNFAMCEACYIDYCKEVKESIFRTINSLKKTRVVKDALAVYKFMTDKLFSDLGHLSYENAVLIEALHKEITDKLSYEMRVFYREQDKREKEQAKSNKQKPKR